MTLQVAALGFMAGEREWVVRTGRTVFVRTAPVDPRDVMRGDYVRLNYEMSRVPRTLCRGALAGTNAPGETTPRDLKVYALLHEDEGVAELTALSDERPREGLFIRGRTDRSWDGHVSVRYGLEAYFMEQGKGQELEQGRQREGIQVPLEMEVAVGSGGLAVLKHHRWSKLGIGLDLETVPDAQSNRPNARIVVAAKVKLLNAGSNDLAVVDLPGGQSLALVPDAQWGVANWEWITPNQPVPKPTKENVVVLKPGAIHVMRVDFRNPRWQVRGHEPGSGDQTKMKTRSLSDLQQDFSARFRFEYRPPNRETCADLPNATMIWHGRMPTRAFNPGGSVD